MARNIMAVGLKIKCMEREFFSGLMVEDMKENMKKTKNMDMVFSLGLMVENTMDKYSHFLLNKT